MCKYPSFPRNYTRDVHEIIHVNSYTVILRHTNLHMILHACTFRFQGSQKNVRLALCGPILRLCLQFTNCNRPRAPKMFLSSLYDIAKDD